MTLEERLRDAGQSHLVHALEQVTGSAHRGLSAQIAELDLPLVRRLVEELVLHPSAPAHERPGPPEVVELALGKDAERREVEARAAGEAALRAGHLAAVLLAGGQGTRLGFEGPKGNFPVGPVSGRTLFSLHAARIEATRARYGCRLPLCVMTSPGNDAETRAIFARNEYFGLRGDVHFFVQGTLPAVDSKTGEILLETPSRLALSPDGHGGLLKALRRSGLLGELRAGGTRTIVTFQVDNPLVRPARPELIGHHRLAKAEMTSVVVRKLDAGERVGVVATVGGRTAVVEYSDLPEEMARLSRPDGSLVFWAGNIALHCLELGFVERLTGGALELSYHRAEKSVPHLGLEGSRAETREPNAVKFETFVFDALPFAERALTLEADRAEEYSPIKNARGRDSPETARRDLTRLYAGWLRRAGVDVPRGGDGEPAYGLEVDPRLALDAEELRSRLPGEFRIDGPTALGPEETVLAHN